MRNFVLEISRFDFLEQNAFEGHSPNSFGWGFKPLERFWDPLLLPRSKNYISTQTILKARRSTPFQPEGDDHGDSIHGAKVPSWPDPSRPPPMNAKAGSAGG